MLNAPVVPCFPARLASAVSLDLEEAGWSNQLLTAGFAPCQPTVWILEGLLYYLQPDVVPHLLQVAHILPCTQTCFFSLRVHGRGTLPPPDITILWRLVRTVR